MLKLFAEASISLWLNIVLAYQEMLERFDYIGEKLIYNGSCRLSFLLL